MSFVGLLPWYLGFESWCCCTYRWCGLCRCRNAVCIHYICHRPQLHNLHPKMFTLIQKAPAEYDQILAKSHFKYYAHLWCSLLFVQAVVLIPCKVTMYISSGICFAAPVFLFSKCILIIISISIYVFLIFVSIFYGAPEKLVAFCLKKPSFMLIHLNSPGEFTRVWMSQTLYCFCFSKFAILIMHAVLW